MIAALEKENPQVPINIFRAMERVKLSEVIGYRDQSGLHRFDDFY